MLNIVLLDTQRLPLDETKQLQQKLSHLGNFVSHISSTDDDIIARCIDAEVVIVDKLVLGKEHFVQLPKLKYIVVVATGYDNVDVAAAHEHGIAVSNVPNYSTESVAQHTIAMMLEFSNQIHSLSMQVKLPGQYFALRHKKNIELSGLTLGIIGFGNIAQAVARIALAFGMKVLVNSRHYSYTTELNVQFVSQEILFKQSDFISLHCPLNPSSKEIINKNTLALMRPSAYIINTARGGLINEADLVEALSGRQIAGAALDVLTQEPPDAANSLLKLDNCIITPHNSWLSKATMRRWESCIVANVTQYVTKQPLINLV